MHGNCNLLKEQKPTHDSLAITYNSNHSRFRNNGMYIFKLGNSFFVRINACDCKCFSVGLQGVKFNNLCPRKIKKVLKMFSVSGYFRQTLQH